MNSTIQQVRPEDSGSLARILIKAYPGPEGISEERLKQIADNLKKELADGTNRPTFGAYRNGELLGAFTLPEFTMNLRSATVKIGGVAGLCVDLLHKKEKVARDLMAFALDYYRGKGIHLSALYPFQSEFYKRMGYGYGTTIHQFSVRPDAFPKGSTRAHLVYLTKSDKDAMLACYHECFTSVTGMFRREEQDMHALFHDANTVVGVRRNDRITGYMVFSFPRVKPEYPQKYNILVKEMIYTTHEAFTELCAFLNAQSDQAQRVIVRSQDDRLYYALHDPTNGQFDNFHTTALESYVSAIGMMCRVLNTRDLFEQLAQCDFNGMNGCLKLTVRDSFCAANNDSVLLNFIDGRPSLDNPSEPQAVIELDVADLSSLLMGAVRFRTLYDYGLARISDFSKVGWVDRLFISDRAPGCVTVF